MLRFRNPTSDVNQLCDIYKCLYINLSDEAFFTNDDIKRITTNFNLMSSSGFTGKKAAAQGYNADKSRDRTFNNSKMLAEVYRHLGLISVVDSAKSHYRFTYLGQHMLVPGVDLRSFIEQCYFGMVSPNRIIDVVYKDEMRFCLFAMNVIDSISDKCICKWELALGPMCGYDYVPDAVCETVKRIDNVRKNGNIIDEIIALGKTCTEAKSAGITKQPIDNYTRLLISMFKYTGLLEENKSPKYYKKKGNRVDKFFQLTAYGASKLRAYNNMKDLRLSEYDKCSDIEKKALIRIGFYQMLNRIGFDTSPISEQLKEDIIVCSEILQGKELLFSPYQMLEYHVVNDALGISEKVTLHSASTTDDASKNASHSSKGDIRRLKLISKITTDIQNSKTDAIAYYISHVNDLMGHSTSIINVVNTIIKEHQKDNMDQYYSFIVMLFRIMGLDCKLGRHGDNSSRMDAIIVDDCRSIPIEIKSPGETEYVNVKAIRQALENKIILLSRKEYKTTVRVPSFAIGYKLPNDRSDVPDLIKAIKETYGFSIVAFGLETLVENSVRIIIEQKGIELDELFSLEEGMIK